MLTQSEQKEFKMLHSEVVNHNTVAIVIVAVSLIATIVGCALLIIANISP